MTGWWKRRNTDDKQALFVVCSVVGLIIAGAGVASLAAWNPAPVLATLLVVGSSAAFMAIVGGLMWLAEHLFTEEG